MSLAGPWPLFSDTVNSYEGLLIWIPYLGGPWWIHVLSREPGVTRKNKIWAWRASDLLKDFSSDAQKDFSWVFHGCEMSWALVSLIQAIGHAHEPSRAALLHHPYLPLSYQRKPEFFQCHLLKANNPMSFRSTHPLNEQGKKHHKEWCGFWSVDPDQRLLG